MARRGGFDSRPRMAAGLDRSSVRLQDARKSSFNNPADGEAVVATGPFDVRSSAARQREIELAIPLGPVCFVAVSPGQGVG